MELFFKCNVVIFLIGYKTPSPNNKNEKNFNFKHNTVIKYNKPTFIHVRKFFARLAGASSVQIFCSANQSLKPLVN